jgi:hypothetical protein
MKDTTTRTLAVASFILKIPIQDPAFANTDPISLFASEIFF